MARMRGIAWHLAVWLFLGCFFALLDIPLVPALHECQHHGHDCDEEHDCDACTLAQTAELATFAWVLIGVAPVLFLIVCLIAPARERTGPAVVFPLAPTGRSPPAGLPT
jgi:hypothetical protein